MKRRRFLESSSLAGAGLAGLSCAGEAERDGAPAADGTGGGTLLAGKTLTTLRTELHSALFDEYLPYLDRYAVDHEYGGFMCNSHPDGVRIDTNKRAWYEGRGLWLYSRLYNDFGGNGAYRAFADKTAGFVMRLEPTDDSFWPGTYTREGKPLKDGEIYCDLFIALGLQEYAKIPGNERYRVNAKRLLMKCVRRYDSPDYPAKPFLPGGPDITAPRMLGHWMILTCVASRMLEAGDDPEVRAVLDRSIDAIMNHHYNESYGLMNEVLNHDLSRPGNAYSQWSYVGHAVESLWFIMAEAVRRKDRALFDIAAERYMRHVEVAWDDVYTGIMRSINHVDEDRRMLDVILLFQMEGLIGTAILVEHTGSAWSKRWFGKIYDHIVTKYELRKFGYSPWMRSGDRVPKEEYSYKRTGNFHYPQALVYVIAALDRMIARDGKPSGVFT